MYPVENWVGSKTIAEILLSEFHFSFKRALHFSSTKDSCDCEVGYSSFGHPQIIPPRVKGDPWEEPEK